MEFIISKKYHTFVTGDILKSVILEANPTISESKLQRLILKYAKVALTGRVVES